MPVIEIEEFLDKRSLLPVIDVRSPAEYERAHIPGAINIPIFSNEERAIVGTLYKQTGRQAAILKGLELVGPKMKKLASDGLKITKNNSLLIHCWRGGMRSANMAWLFNTVGIKAYLLQGGYKAYRRYVKHLFSYPYNLKVINGRTGSGKTEILIALKQMGEQVIDLEGLANHRGSAFGALGNPPQPVTEHFENLIGDELLKMNTKKPIWVEDESHSIGKVFIPDELFNQFMGSKIISIEVPVKERIKRLVKEYSDFPKELLAESITKIKKRLGGLNYKLAIEALDNDDYAEIAKIVLLYYDKAYSYGLENKPAENVVKISLQKDHAEKNAKIILNHLKMD